MNQNLTEVVFIIDRSGSMSDLVDDTIGGFNSFVNQQKKESGEARLTTVLFDDYCEILHNAINIQDVPMLTEKEYSARGMTAMLDAVGRTIDDVGKRLANTKEEERPGKVVVIIVTDGQDNSSKIFKKNQIKEMIERQQDVYSWKFLFLGANIDSFSEADSLGINRDFTANYTASTTGTISVYSAVSKGVSSARCSTNGDIVTNWSVDIQ